MPDFQAGKSVYVGLCNQANADPYTIQVGLNLMPGNTICASLIRRQFTLINSCSLNGENRNLNKACILHASSVETTQKAKIISFLKILSQSIFTSTSVRYLGECIEGMNFY